MDIAEIQRVTGNCDEQYLEELETLEEMNKFLDPCSPPKLNYKDIENLNRTRSNIGKISQKY